MIPATILHEAEVEIWESVHYYEAKCPGLGTDFINEVESVLVSIRTTPNLWRVREDGTQRCLLRRFPYVVVYLHFDNNIWVIAVAHCRRKPEYWSERIEHVRPENEIEP